MKRRLKIDAHHHFVPDTLPAFIRQNAAALHVQVVEDGDNFVIKNSLGNTAPIFTSMYDIEQKLSDMENMGIEMTVLSLAPSFVFYDAEPQAALEAAKLCNNWVAQQVRTYAGRFAGMASVPMQEVSLALQELKRAREELGLRALEITPIIEGVNLDDERFLPVFQYCAENDMLLYLHPSAQGDYVFYENYYNANLTGNPLETCVGLNHLIFGGVLEKFPQLKVLASHGGGFFPYQFGRLMHGYKVRSEPKVNIPASPEKYLGQIYFDTITHWVPPLQFLVDTFGADHLVLGTDYPYDMGDYEPVQKADALRLNQQERELVYGGTIVKLLGL